jgi:hypothetical protein
VTSMSYVRFLCKSAFLVVMFAVLPVSGEVGVRNSIAISASERLLPLENTLNTRDLGGSRTGDGRIVKRGYLYRSDSLAKLGGSDQQYLAELGLSVITDFRSDQERLEAPDRLPEQASSLFYEVVPVNNPAVDVAELGQKVFSGDLSEAELLQLLDRTS